MLRKAILFELRNSDSEQSDFLNIVSPLRNPIFEKNRISKTSWKHSA
jgi:hypothetical protein